MPREATPPAAVNLAQLRRIRWAVRGTLAFGVAASVAANVLHARQDPISETIAAWPPLALLLTVELVSRVPMHRPLLAAVRVLATIVISGIAAWVSYWHMAGVAARYGETGTSPYLLPVSVDGLIVVASICLVELAGRIRVAESTTRTPAEVSTVGGLEEPAAAPAMVAPIPEPEPHKPAPPSPVAQVVGGHLRTAGPTVDDGLLRRARAVAAGHRRTTGSDITATELSKYMRTSIETATDLHRLVQPATTSNGHTVPIGGTA